MATSDITDRPDLGPEHFPVSVILERRPAVAQTWVDHVWTATGIVVGSRENAGDGEPRLIHDADRIRRYLVSGLRVALFADECESYYHNMMTATPRAYVVAHVGDESDYAGDDPYLGENDRPDPFLVSMSFDEAHAYLEGEDEIYEVNIPPELYRWTEAFVLAHYVPEKKYKRKLKNWTEGEGSA